MELDDYINEIKLELTGNVLEIELPDETLSKVVNKAFREIQRYIDTTELITVPYASCIDLSNSGIDASSVSRIFRAEGYLTGGTGGGSPMSDPMYAQQWMIFSNGGSMYSLNDYVLNYAAWNTLLQIRNTATTDLAFKQDKQGDKLYINCLDKPSFITIEYVPKFKDVSEIKSDYWIDILIRLSIALTKVTLGRIRSRYVQSNALWTQDGGTLLQEGNDELEKLRETLRINSQVIYPID